MRRNPARRKARPTRTINMGISTRSRSPPTQLIAWRTEDDSTTSLYLILLHIYPISKRPSSTVTPNPASLSERHIHTTPLRDSPRRTVPKVSSSNYLRGRRKARSSVSPPHDNGPIRETMCGVQFRICTRCRILFYIELTKCHPVNQRHVIMPSPYHMVWHFKMLDGCNGLRFRRRIQVAGLCADCIAHMGITGLWGQGLG